MFLKRLVIIIIAIVLVGLGFQAIRSFLLLRFINNVNTLEELAEPVSAEIPEGLDVEKYLIINDKTVENSKKTTEQTKKTLDYMKKGYEIIGIEDIETVSFDYDAILVATERLDYLGELQNYIEYVKDGGSLVLLTRPVADITFRSNYKIFGIDDFSSSLIESKGIRIITDILIGAEGFESDTGMISNSSIDLELSKDSDLQVTSFDGNPLLWKKDIGQGKVVFFNGTMLNEKINRGLIVSVLSLAIQDLVYPIINTKMVHIDDFPAPIPEGDDLVISEEFERDIQQFYKEVWWSDMVKYAKQKDLLYTGFVIENYGNDVEPPFREPTDKEIGTLLVYGKELLRLGGEIGLHGYNHQSLALEGYIKQDLGYKPWESLEDMAEAHKKLIDFIGQVFEDYELRAYVPPSNILSPEGREAVKRANPDLKIIASVYLENAEGDVYSQEFSIADDGIIEYPRISAGYHNEEETVWAIYNGANVPGIFAHFIHPDDILDPHRNKGKSWTEMTEEYELLLDEVAESYSWLRPHTISESSNELVKFLECDLYCQKLDDRIVFYVEDFRKEIYCILRTEKNLEGKEDLDYEKIGQNSYLLTINDAVSTIYLEEEKD